MDPSLSAPPLPAVRCPSCRAGYLGRGGPCPRCGHAPLERHEIPASAVVLAATEILVPPIGFSAPHRIALLEAADGVRLLANIAEPGAAVGAIVEVRVEGSRIWAQAKPGPA